MNLKTWLRSERGRVMAMSERFGVSPQAISQWPVNGIPRDHMLAVRDFTRGEVTLEEMLGEFEQRMGVGRVPGCIW
jgi:DNA-binding transcriptional regulator YdaS (Cro superfamily)